MSWTRVASADQVDEGDIKAFYLGDLRLAVARSEGALYAFEDVCTHKQCSLSDGDVEGVSLMCPVTVASTTCPRGRSSGGRRRSR